MKKLIVLLVLAVVLISGCTQTINVIGAQTGIGLTNIGEIVNNPEEYYQKNLTVTGRFSRTFGGANLLIDDQDYRLTIVGCEESHRDLEIGAFYKAEGVIERTEYGECQYIYSEVEGNCVQTMEACKYSTAGKEGVYCDQSYPNYPKIIYFMNMENQTVTTENFETNHSLSIFELRNIKTNWTNVKSYLMGKEPVSSCPSEKIEQYVCNYDIYGYNVGEFIKTEKIGSVNGSFVKEYRIIPNSIDTDYYFECIEPMIKLS